MLEWTPRLDIDNSIEMRVGVELALFEECRCA